jgi:hypothetical protein
MNNTITITAVLLNWKRPENIVKTIKSIRDQSIPIKICLWNNNPDDRTRHDVDIQIDSPNNFKCYPRWMMASLIETDYIFTLDDDLMLNDNNVIKDILDFYESINTNDKLILGYTGVILNQDKDYWESEHITEPKNIDIKVDIVKGRFMFMSKNLIKNITLENEETCEDIKISSYSDHKLIPSILKNRLLDLDEMGVGLFGSNDHNLKRLIATKKYFTENIEIRDIMNKYGSDKGGCGRFSCHNYTNLYQLLFNNIKKNNLNIFELGLGTNNTDIAYNMGPSGKPGASLKAWKEFLPNSMIYGADIDKRVLFNEDRIKTFYCDQTNSEVIKDMWNSEDLKNIEFDFIIDDGLHEFDANITFFESSLHKLKVNGYFIIEDLKSNTVSMMKKYISDVEVKYKNFEFSLFELYLHNNQNDNNLLVIRRKK